MVWHPLDRAYTDWRRALEALADALKLGGDMTQIDLQRELLGNEEIKAQGEC